MNTSLTLVPIDGPALTTDCICYRITCKQDIGEPVVTDQFGERPIRQSTRDEELCVPAVK